MPHSDGSTRKSALVICFSPVANDARVTKEIRWLEEAGYRVDVLSRGPEQPYSTGDYLAIGDRPVRRLRLALMLLLHPRHNFRFYYASQIPHEALRGHKYDLVYVNDHHLLPWLVEVAADLTDGPVVLDLHELYEGNGVGWKYRVAQARQDRWLLTFFGHPAFTHRLTVAEGIADIYRDQYGLPRPGVIRNVAPYEELEPTPVDPDHIRLVHHGYASVERGIDIMLDAMLEADSRFTLELMVLGNDSAMAPLRSHPAVAAGRATFREPVEVTQVARALNECDLELIFFPPRFPNNTYALPNKFFEAVQGRLGVIIGESPEIVPFVKQHGLGVVVEGWTGSDLAAVLNALTAEDVMALKRASHQAAKELSTVGEGPRFLSLIGVAEEPQT